MEVISVVGALKEFLTHFYRLRLLLGNACCHSVQNLLSSSLLSKKVKFKRYRIVILRFVFLWV